MKKIKMLVLGLFFGLGAILLSFSPIKAQDYRGDNMGYDGDYMMPGYNYSTNYSLYRNYDYMNRFRRNFRTMATYPRTVYLVDASNSANQLNIINATRGGTTTAAYITVRSSVYNRVVDDYNQLGVVSIRVDRATRLVTFMTVNGTYSTYPITISWQ